MRIIIIGGHGKVALLASPRLVANGHEVTGVIRTASQSSDVAATGATPLVADVAELDVGELASLIADHDALLWTAGAGGGDPERTRAIDRDAAIRSMEAARIAGVQRYVMISYFGAGPDHGVDPSNTFHAYAEAKAAADTHLAGTDLAWTILRPSSLTDDPATGHINADDRADGTQVARADVAGVIAAVIDRPRTARSIISFNAGSVAIDEAITQFEH